MTLPVPSVTYAQSSEAQFRAELARQLARKIERGVDLELSSERLILTSPNGTRYAISVNDLGMITAAAL